MNNNNYITWDVYIRVWYGEKFKSISFDHLLELTVKDKNSAIEFAHHFYDPKYASILDVRISDRKLFTDLATIPSLLDS